MRNKFIFGVVLTIVCVAIWGIFSLIFSETGTLMMLNTISGMLMAVIVMMNFIMTTSRSSLSVRNAASMTVLTTLGGILFVWTFVFTFLIGDYKDSERSLTSLYVGYLIILVISAVLLLMADRGGSVSQEKNIKVQARIEYKSELLSKLNSAKIMLNTVEPNTRADVHKLLSLCISSFQSIPTNKLNEQCVIDSGLGSTVENVLDAINSGDIQTISRNLKELSLTILKIK